MSRCPSCRVHVFIDCKVGMASWASSQGGLWFGPLWWHPLSWVVRCTRWSHRAFASRRVRSIEVHPSAVSPFVPGIVLAVAPFDSGWLGPRLGGVLAVQS